MGFDDQAYQLRFLDMKLKKRFPDATVKTFHIDTLAAFENFKNTSLNLTNPQ